MGTIPKLEDCNPGFRPVEYKVIIAPEEVETVTKGGIILADRTAETEALAQVRGLLVDVSPLAFNFDQWPEDMAHLRPKAGDHVIYGKYLGTLVKGDDGREYRVLHDKDIMGVVTRSNAEPLKAVA
jgi:co-chaperonin GroES (HSP10)